MVAANVRRLQPLGKKNKQHQSCPACTVSNRPAACAVWRLALQIGAALNLPSHANKRLADLNLIPPSGAAANQRDNEENQLPSSFYFFFPRQPERKWPNVGGGRKGVRGGKSRGNPPVYSPLFRNWEDGNSAGSQHLPHDF